MPHELSGKKILLGITGGIAAYKSAFLLRLLVKAGAEVKVIMTPAAREFVTPLTLSTLSGNPVSTDFYDANGNWENHVEFGLWADLMLIAPVTANTLSKMTSGAANNLLIATYLSAKCPVMIAPAMDLDMYKHPTTKQNLSLLVSYGHIVLNSPEGELASGLSGSGRMEEPEQILEAVREYFELNKLKLKGKKILITAGPTVEPIDPVRYISNFSSGKMGYALAQRALELGAEVTLISGPVDIDPPKHVNFIPIQTAEELYEHASMVFGQMDIGIMAAAVSDYAPATKSDQKIKKSTDALSIELKKNPDTLLELGKVKKEHQILVGFALETNNERANALSKKKKKNLDFIVLNSLKDKGAGFGTDTNKVTVIDQDNKTHAFELKSKTDVAKDILNLIVR